MRNTRDLSDFGQIERREAGRLLTTLGTVKDLTKFLGDGVAVEFNTYSGMVFLVDEDYNVAVMNGHNLEDFHSCPNCGNEAVSSEFRSDFKSSDCCQEYANELGLK
jgi:hypothetical protein